MTQNEWLEAFKAKNGRQPNMDEFQTAKAAGFPAMANPVSADVMKAWVEEFNEKMGRKPTLDEVKAKKEAMAKAEAEKLAAAERPTVADEPEETAAPVETPAEAAQPAQPAQAAQAAHTAQAAPAGQAPQATPKRPKQKKSVLKTVLIALAVVFAAAIAFGFHYYSEDASMERAVKAFKSYDADKYAAVSEWSDSKKKMTADELAPMAAYMKDKDMSESSVKSWLRDGNNGAEFVRDGSYLLIFPRYKVSFRPVELSVNTNQSGLKITMNDKTITKNSDSDYSKVLSHLAAGQYRFNAEGELNGQKVKTQSVEFIGGSKKDSVDLNIKTLSFNVESNIEGGNIFVGDAKVGKIQDGKAELKNIAVTKGADIYVKSGDLKSKSKSLSDVYEGDTVYLDAKDALTKDSASYKLEDMASALTYYGYGEKNSSNLSKVFNGGSSNDSYKGFQENIKHNLHTSKRNAKSVAYSGVSVKKVSQTAKGKADVEFEMKASFYYPPETDPDGKNSFGTLDQNFAMKAHMVYDKDSETWLIDSIDKDQKLLSKEDNVN